MSKQHSTRGASGCHIWSRCAGQPRMVKGLPKKDTVFSLEGQRAHDLAEADLLGRPVVGDVEEDMAAYVRIYTDYCRELMRKADGFAVEAKFALTELHPDLFGTSDFVAWKHGEWLECVDLKYGMGHRVAIRNNLQLRYYALGAVQSLDGILPPIIKTTIVQPRLGEDCISTAEYSAFDMLEFSVELRDAAQRTDDPDAPLNAGGWCQFCSATHKCPALLASVLALRPGAWTEEEKADEAALTAALLNAAEQAKFFVRGIEERALNLAQGGMTIPGYTMTQKRAMRKLLAPEEAAHALKELGMADEDLWETELKSPSALETTIRLKYKPVAGMLKEALARHTTRVSSGYRLDPVRQPGQLANGVAEYGTADLPESEL